MQLGLQPGKCFMTTTNKVWDRTSTVNMTDAGGRSYSGLHVGEFSSKVASGSDRPVGQRPGFIPYLQNINTKPLIRRGKVLVPSRTYTVRKWKPDPNYQPYQENHPYTATIVVVTGGNGLAAHSGSTHINCGTAWTLPPFLKAVADPFSAADQIRNLGNLRERIAGSSFNAGVALGEAPKTLKMVSETATRIYTAFKQVRRGDVISGAQTLLGKREVKATPLPRNGRSAPQEYLLTDRHGDRKTRLVASKHAAAGNWLALQYGWKPLLTDIYEGMVFVDHQLRNPVVHRVSSTAYAAGKKDGVEITVPIDSGPTHAWIYHRQVSSERIIAFLKEKDVIRLTGLLDPASVAWELLPYSFVIDWFIPVGNYLSAKGLANSLKGTFVTTRFMRITSLPSSSAVPRGGWTLDTKMNYSGNKSKLIKVNRTVSTTLQVPLPEVVPLSKAVSWARATNAVALLTNLAR